jgi:hypothetical protein
MMSTHRKMQDNYTLWLLLAVTLGLTLWMALQEDVKTEEVVLNETKLNDQTTSKNNRQRRSDTAKPSMDSAQNASETVASKLQTNAWQLNLRVQSGQPKQNLFVAHSWAPPPPKLVLKSEPPPSPVAPEAPFFYMGKLEEEDGSKQFFMLAQQKLFHVRLGEKINTEWRLDGESDQFLQLTYLPLGLSQTLSKLKKQVSPALGLDTVATAN